MIIFRSFGTTCPVISNRRPEGSDWEKIQSFLRATERRDLHLRFGASLNFDDNATLQKYFGARPEGEMIWVLDGEGAIAGIAHRALVLPDEAEVALIVRSDMKRRRIGTRLLACAVNRSAEDRLKFVTGFVLQDNYPVLSLAAKFGFRMRECHGLNVEIELALEESPHKACGWRGPMEAAVRPAPLD